MILFEPIKSYSFLCLITLCIVFSWSCQTKSEAGQPLSDEQKSHNLTKNGKIDPDLLIGEWDIIKFAYTPNGNKISNVANIPIDPIYDIELIASLNGISIDEAIDRVRPKLQIPNPPINPLENEWLWNFSGCNWMEFKCSISENLINFIGKGSTYKGCSPQSTDNEISFALLNAYNFVIKGDEFVIFFTGIENIDKDKKKDFVILKKHNLLILKKR